MPLPKLFLPFALGIIAYLLYGKPVPWFSHVAAVIFLAMAWKFSRFFIARYFSSRMVYGFGVNCYLFVAAFFIAQQHDQQHCSRHFSRFNDHEGYLLVRVIEPVSERANSYRVVVSVKKFSNDSMLLRTSGGLMLYLQKDSLAAGIQYGDELVLENNYDVVPPPQNPHAFNYRRFLAMKNIFHSSYVRSGHWHLTGENNGQFFVRWALLLRQQAMDAFRENNLSGREFAVISALLLGYREYLDEDLRREFAGAGAMHILCVSGLHVGIIFMVLKYVFSFLCRLPGGMILRTLFIIMFIWLYAAITGFSPSVLRASVMFTFVAAGQSFRRPTNIYNTLAASAFVLMIANPFIITYIGFQLSYLAVISIVALQPPLYEIVKFKHTLLDKAWSIITVSIAAQLATGPLALYYFNQFPNYFLVTNLVVIPLASTIIYTALLTLLLSPIAYAGALMGKLLSLIVAFLHHSVRFIEGLPHSTSNGVYLSLPETFLIFILIVAMAFTLMQKSRPAFLFSLGLIALLVTSFAVRSISNACTQQFVVYSVRRATAVDFFSGNELMMLAGKDFADDIRQQEFAMSGMRLRYGHKEATHLSYLHATDSVSEMQNFIRKNDMIAFDDKRLLIIHSSSQVDWYRHIQQSIEPDYLLITGNPRLDVPALLKVIKPALVILDASNSAWNAARLEEACREAGVDVWNINEKGAYVGR